MQTQKSDSILAEHRQETFEFAPVRQLDGDRVVSNVQNHSHDDGKAHIYPVFFENTGSDIEVAECGCPADEFHGGACKHREAASECSELLEQVQSTCTMSNGETATATDGGTAVEDIKRVVDADCVEWDVVENNPEIVWLKRDDGGFDEDLWFTDPDKFHDAVAASEFIPIDSEGDQ